MLKKIGLVGLCVLLVLSGALLGGCSKADDTDADVPTLEIPEEEIPTAAEAGNSTRTTVVYYQDASGYLIPVTRTIAWEEGIAKATLSLMVKNEENDTAAASLGLQNVVPEGTTIDIDIGADKLAKVSLSKEADTCANAADETNMVSAIVCALTEFGTVETVQIMLGGAVVPTLKNGTSVGEPLSRSDINLESLGQGVSVDGANKITLYFESAESGAMVPVTRMVFSNNDLETAVLELLRGPKENSGLIPTLPSSAALLSVTKENGVVTINFTDEFVNIANETDGGKNAIKSLMLTCAQFEGVKEVKLQVNGKPWEPESATLAVPTFVNSEDEDIYNFNYDE